MNRLRNMTTRLHMYKQTLYLNQRTDILLYKLNMHGNPYTVERTTIHVYSITTRTHTPIYARTYVRSKEVNDNRFLASQHLRSKLLLVFHTVGIHASSCVVEQSAPSGPPVRKRRTRTKQTQTLYNSHFGQDSGVSPVEPLLNQLARHVWCMPFLAGTMPTSIARIALYIALPFSAALLVLAFCSFARRGRRAGAGQVRGTPHS